MTIEMTAEKVTSLTAELLIRLRNLTFLPDDFVIEDYPIGGRNRGQCRISVEHDRKKGRRTVRQTTDKYGSWCKPKKSTYRRDYLAVVCAGTDEWWLDTMAHGAAWFGMGPAGIYLQYANGVSQWLFQMPCTCKPRREAKPYTTTTTGPGGVVIATNHGELPADPPELCDAWDAWETAFREIAGDVVISEVVANG